MAPPASPIDVDELPRPSTSSVAVRLTPPGERAVRSGHPWIFEGSVRSVSREGRAGDVAVVFDRKNRFLAVGLYEPSGPIRVRVLREGETAPIGPAFFAATLDRALERRAPLRSDPGLTGYRLVHGESDGFPGLVLDRYGEALVLKLYSPIWIPRLREVLPAIESRLGPQVLVGLASRRLAADERCPAWLRSGGRLLGDDDVRTLPFVEAGLRFEAHPYEGQKTGFYLDQRDNRRTVGGLASGARVLNVFSYTGGFSVLAAQGGAREVTSVDRSGPALDQAERHLRLNPDACEGAHHATIQGDAFEVLDALGAEGRRFDLVIVDPPSFATSSGQRARALDAYASLTRLALGVLDEGGLLVQASCSARVPADDFFARVHETARTRGRELDEIERTGHPLDHPVGFPEAAYLKCLFARA